MTLPERREIKKIAKSKPAEHGLPVCSMIRRYINWHNRHADDQRLRAVVDRANVA